jgi:dihydrofolate synthase/folylpolyglutamate synthase
VNVLDYLRGLEQFGIKLGLDSIRTLCRELGDPQLAFRSVIIAGTNGKGSVAAMTERALRAGGVRTGRYTSPHLVRLEERFVVGGDEVESGRFERSAAIVIAAIDRLVARRELPGPPTFFEATTAIAFEVFRRAGVELAVLEVGLGGRLDATNIVQPLAAAITSIARDHERQLGETLAAIASEKAGVIKPGIPVVIGELPDEAREVIARTAAEQGAPLIEAAGGVRIETNRRAGDLELELQTPVRSYPPLIPALRGRHQIGNAVVSVRLLETLESRGVGIGAEAIAAGLQDVRWPGRLEWIEGPGGRLLLDAAHNPAGARALSSYLADLGPMPLVFGVANDKDVEGMLRALVPVVTRVVLTQATISRAMPAAELARRARAALPDARFALEPDPFAAVALALGERGRACVAGSIFLIGEVRGRLVR